MSEEWKSGVMVSMRDMRKREDHSILGQVREANFDDNLILMDTGEGDWKGTSQEFEKVWEVAP